MGDQQQQQQPHQHQQHAPYALPPPTSSIMYGAAAGQGHTGSTHSPQAQSHAQFYAHSHQQQPEQSSPCGGGGGGGGSTSGTTPQQQQQQAYQQQQLYAQQQYHQEQSSHNSSMDDVSGGPSGGSGGGAAGGGSESIGGASAKKSSNTTTSTSAVKDKDKDKEQDKDDGKFSRSKGACQQCRAVKQRCSGAAKHPCERCQLYKLECIFSKDPPPQKESGPSSRTMKKAAMKQASSDPETGAAVLQSLRVITERLRTIEESLALQQRAGSAGPQASTSGQNGYGSYPSSATSQSYGFDGDVKRPLYDGPALTSVGGGEVADPITTVTSAIKGLDQAMAAASPFAGGSQAGTPDGSSPQQHVNGNGANAVGANFEPDVPDAVSRGFVTVEEAQQLFDFYFSRCAHWTPPLDVHNDRNMHHVRRRSTFLFHAILSVASYFCYVPQGENGLRKYYAIVTTLVESLAPIVVSPNPAELTVDLLMGLLLCIQWKPVRCGSQMQLGPAGFSKLQAQSKLNPSSGYVLGGLALRISQLLGLARRASHPNPANRQSIQACRLWLWINLVDSQGALAEGKSPALDPSDALRVTRLFASIRSKPGDVRLAAMVELYAAVVPIVAAHHGASKTDFRALYRANAVLDRITVYWAPHIEDAYGSGDALAATFLNVFVPFVRVVLNADVFRTWLIRRKAESKGGEIDLETARHTLTSEEAHCIGFAVSAAEEMLYYLSTASRAEGAARKHTWAPRDMQTGHRPSLYLDSELARLLSSSVDSILLVIYAFPPLFLAQLRAQNIINCDLDMAPEITNDLFSVGFPSRALLPASKFMRLLEVSAEFYEATSPNKDFPAIPQAQLLRTMACLSAPVGISTSLPNFSNGELSFLDGSGLPGASEGGTAPACGIDMGAAAKAYQYQMQQISAHAPPTNTDLPYPYNTMVFSTEGADRLDAIMQQSVPDPLSGTSLLGSFAKIDADWNAYFNPAQNVPGAQQQQQQPPQQHAQQDIYASLAQTQHIRNSPDSVHSHVGASPQQQQQQYYTQQQPLPGMGNYHPQQQQQMVSAPILNSHAGRSY